MKIRNLKNLFLETAVTPGEALAVVPDSPFGKACARTLGNRFEVPSVNDKEFAERYTEERYLENRHIISVGDIWRNRLSFILYSRRFCFVDAKYPGDDGYVFETIHNPFGHGRNVVFVGGSGEEGTKKAVDDFHEFLGASGEILPRIHSHRPPRETADDRVYAHPYALRGTPPSDAEIEDIGEESRRKFLTGTGVDCAHQMIDAGMRYYTTGVPGWALLFKRIFAVYTELAVAPLSGH